MWVREVRSEATDDAETVQHAPPARHRGGSSNRVPRYQAVLDYAPLSGLGPIPPTTALHVDEVNGIDDRRLFTGVVREINLALLDGPFLPGEYILIHSGFALERMTEAQAREALTVFEDGDMTSSSVWG